MLGVNGAAALKFSGGCNLESSPATGSGGLSPSRDYEGGVTSSDVVFKHYAARGTPVAGKVALGASRH